MSGKERENLLRIYVLLVDTAKDSLIEFFELYLQKQNITFEDFINLNQHSIYHLCFNTRRCCDPACTYSRQNPFCDRRILSLDQIDILINKHGSTRQPYHRQSSRDYCCCMAKSGIQTKILDVTLVNCLLINFCHELFWDCCLQKQTFDGFLNQHKHMIYHLTHRNQVCCLCTGSSCFANITLSLEQLNWSILFSPTGLSTCTKTIGQHTCICSVSAAQGIGIGNLDMKCINLLQKQLCPSRNALETLVSIRNKYAAHPDDARLSDNAYENVKRDVENALLTLARETGNEVKTRRNLREVEQISLNEELCVQYRNTLLQQIQRDGALEQIIMGTLPKIMQSSVEAVTKGKLQFIEQKLERIEDLLIRLLGDGQDWENQIHGFCDEVKKVQLEGCLVEDFGNVSHTQDIESIGVAQNLSGTLETGLDIAMKFLSTIGFVKPEIAAGLNLLATARALYKNYTESDIKDKIEKLVQEKIDDEYLNEYEGIIELYTSSIAFLNGIGVQKLTDIELNLLWDTIKIFHSVVFVGKFRKRISDLINDCERFRDFVKLMQYIEKYMTLVFLRDVVFVMVCKVLEVNSSKTLRVLKAMKSLISYQRIQDTNLLHFLVTPKKKTIYLNFLYSPNKWPTVQQLLHEYFFCDTRKTNDLSFLCEGEYVMTPVQYENSCLFFADVRFTWLRWSYAHEADTQSRLRFVKHEIEGKIYFQIFSVKWPQYFARMGNDGWWVRGRCDEEPDNYGLWEIIQFDDNGDEMFMLAPKDSKANFMRVDVFGRIFGSRCMPGLHTFFQIKAQFFDALEEFAKTDDE